MRDILIELRRLEIERCLGKFSPACFRAQDDVQDDPKDDVQDALQDNPQDDALIIRQKT